MHSAATGVASRGRLVRLLVTVLVMALFVMISSGVYAQSDRKSKRDSEKSSAKRETQSRRESDGNRDAGKKSSGGSRAEEISKSADRETKSSGGKSSGASSRTGKESGTSGRSGDSHRNTGSRAIERDRSGTSTRDRLENRSDDRAIGGRKYTPYDRYRRTKRDDDRDRGGEKREKKKINPGYGKKIVKPGEKRRIIIDPRPGRYDPPPPPDVDIIVLDPWLPPPPPYPWLPPVIGDYYPDREYVIHLPAGVIEPDEMEPAFLEKIEYLRSIGSGDSFLVCLYQTTDPISSEETNYLFEQGVTFYRFLTSCTAIIDVTVDNIVFLVMEQPNFRWIGEYRAEYKYRHEQPESSRRGAYVHSLAGDSIDFRNALKHLGLRVVAYYEDTEDYYVIADWEQFHEIAGLWWVEKVYKEPETFSDITFNE